MLDIFDYCTIFVAVLIMETITILKTLIMNANKLTLDRIISTANLKGLNVGFNLLKSGL